MQMTLAAALLRRKELQGKVTTLQQLKQNDLFYQIHGERIKVEVGLDELRNMRFPKLDAAEVTAEFDYYARQLRLIDGHIQQANWSTMLNVEDSVDADFVKKG